MVLETIEYGYLGLKINMSLVSPIVGDSSSYKRHPRVDVRFDLWFKEDTLRK